MSRSLPSVLSIVAAVLVLVTGCDAPLTPETTHVTTDDISADRGFVFTPFRAGFFTAGRGLVPHPDCGAFPPRLLNTQVGEGEATQLGRFSVHITFCMDVTDILDDGKLTGEESIPYDNGVGTFVAANGDELYIEISGAVVPSTHPNFDFEFHDPFQIIGGTGRFTGATGEGTTASLVDQSADRTEHDWRGTLILLRGH